MIARRRRRTAAIAVALAALGGAARAAETAGDHLRVASKSFTESVILGEIAALTAAAAGVPVLRGVAAADVPALHAQAQVNPGVAAGQALLAAVRMRLDARIDGLEVFAGRTVGRIVIVSAHDGQGPPSSARSMPCAGLYDEPLGMVAMPRAAVRRMVRRPGNAAPTINLDGHPR